MAIPKDRRDGSLPGKVVKLISKLYKIESHSKTMNPEDRLQLRQTESVVILKQIKDLCSDKYSTMMMKSPTAKAIRYTLDNWELLNVYISNPMLNISNIKAEQAIRPFVIGRKNWMCVSRRRTQYVLKHTDQSMLLVG